MISATLKLSNPLIVDFFWFILFREFFDLAHGLHIENNEQTRKNKNLPSHQGSAHGWVNYTVPLEGNRHRTSGSRCPVEITAARVNVRLKSASSRFD
jgi:hypothetical protein